MQTESEITNTQSHHQEIGGLAIHPIKDKSYN